MTAVQSVPAESEIAADRADRRNAMIVWIAWALMTIAALALVQRYGVNVPTWDDWDMVPALTDHQPVTWGWLWSQHNEHRVPLPRLLMLAVMKPFNADFRGGMYFNVATVSVLAVILMMVSRRLRGGRTRLADVFLPVLLLNWAQGLNFLWGWQVEFFTSTLLAGAALAAVAWSPRLRRSTALVTFGCLALAALCGAHGVALLPAMAMYLLIVAGMRWRAGRSDAGSILLPVLLAALCGALVAVYMYGYEPVPWHPKGGSLRAMFVTALQFLTMSFGSAVRPIWPVSGLAMLALATATALLLIAAFWRRPSERERIAGIFCFLGALVALALGIGMGRNGLEPRYITLSVPAAAAAYLAWVAYGREAGRIGSIAPAVLACMALVALPFNMWFGLAYARELATNLHAVRDDVRSGQPPSRLYAQHGAWLHPHADLAMDYLPMLQRAGTPPYDRLGNEPAFREVPLSLVPSHVQGLTWDRSTDTAVVTSNAPLIRYELPDQPLVAGVRLSYRHRNETGNLPYVLLRYRKPGQATFPAEQFQKYSPTGDRANWERGTYLRVNDDHTTMHTWIYDRIDAIEIIPDLARGTFQIIELTLLLPPEKTPETPPAS